MSKSPIITLLMILSVSYGFSQSQRLVLVEHFTQASCGPCASQNPTLQATLNANSTEAISLKHQVSWPGVDPMYNHYPAGPDDRRTYYGITGVPNTTLDGTSGPGAPNTVVTAATIGARYGVSSPFTINVSFTNSGGVLNASADLQCTQAISGNLVAHIVVIEKHVAFATAPGSNGETDFYNVVKQYLPGTSGSAMAGTWTVGQTQTVNESWTNVYDESELAVVAFIQDVTTKEVHQAGYAPLVLATLSDDAGISSVNNAGNICNTTYTPQLTLNNYGLNTLTSATINYDLDGGPNQTYNWTGSLAPGASTTVTPSPLVVTGGFHTINASTSIPNGNVDPYPANDAIASDLSVGSELINVTVSTDCWGSETSWTITDALSNVWTSGGGYANVTGGQTFNTSYCALPGDCYDFTIDDTYGDGMYGSQYGSCTVDGTYSVDQGATQLATIIAANSDFGVQEINNFCVTSSYVAGLSASDSTLCAGTMITFTDLSTAGTTSWNWSFPGGTPSTSTSQNPTVVYNSPGTWDVSLDAGNGFVNDLYTASGLIAVNSAPVIGAGTVINPSACGTSTGSVSITGSGSGDVSWTGTATGSVTSVSLPYTIGSLPAGSYNITFTDPFGCTSNLVTQAVNDPTPPPTPTVSASGVLTFCDGESVTLTSTSSTGYGWSSGGTGQSIVVTTSGSYSVTVTDASGCSATSTPTVVVVNNNPAQPTITPGGSTSFCEGESVSLISSEGTGNVWSNAEVTQTIFASTDGLYTVTYTDVNGCSSTSASIDITVFALPVVTMSSLGALCTTDATFTLTEGSPAGGVYSGSGVTGGDFSPVAAGVGSHVITYVYIDANGCENSVTGTLDVDDCATVEELTAAGYSIHPNPSRDVIKIERLEVTGDAMMHVYDLNGRIMFNGTLEGHSAKLYVSEWNAGLYILRLTVGAESYVSKLIVQ
jgi:PKD repeat protein